MEGIADGANKNSTDRLEARSNHAQLGIAFSRFPAVHRADLKGNSEGDSTRSVRLGQ